MGKSDYFDAPNVYDYFSVHYDLIRNDLKNALEKENLSRKEVFEKIDEFHFESDKYYDAYNYQHERDIVKLLNKLEQEIEKHSNKHLDSVYSVVEIKPIIEKIKSLNLNEIEELKKYLNM